MKKRTGYLRTVIAILAVAALLAAALELPAAVNGWYDSRVWGQMKYTDMTYDPYEIVCYESFEEELRALAFCHIQGIELLEIRVADGEDEPDDEELLALINEELARMYQEQVLGVPVTAESIDERKLLSMYPVADCRDIYPQNISFRTLVCRTSDDSERSWISLNMDCRYHKIYNFSYLRWEKYYGAMFERDEKERKMKREELSALYCRRWMNYWEISQDEQFELLTDMIEYSCYYDNDEKWYLSGGLYLK